MQNKHISLLYVIWTRWCDYNNYILLYVFRTFVNTNSLLVYRFEYVHKSIYCYEILLKLQKLRTFEIKIMRCLVGTM
jgi:hypothetical protein